MDRWPPGEPLSYTYYEIRDSTGQLHATHVRRQRGARKYLSWLGDDGMEGLGGRTPADLPLYGSQALAPHHDVVIITEGEKACDAVNGALAGIHTVRAVGTVTGSSTVPHRQWLLPLYGRSIILWPDNDEPGQRHMQELGAALQGIALGVRVVSWPAEERGHDAADLSPQMVLRRMWVTQRWRP